MVKIDRTYFNENKERMEEYLEDFFTERNHSKGTKTTYLSTILQFERIIGVRLDKIVEIGVEEKQLEWEDTQIRKWLLKYRKYCIANYKESVIDAYVMKVRTVLDHFRIPLKKLPPYSKKQVRKSEEIDYEDLPDKKILKRCIELKNPLLKAMTLFMSSTGLSRADTWGLTIRDYLKATWEYHETYDIQLAIHLMDKSEVDVIPVFKFPRRKTGETYRTFASPESVKAINNYLLSRENLTLDSRLFDISFRYINDLFYKTNEQLGLGRVNGRSRFCPQMLRVYHATQLAEAGVNDPIIDLLQGRVPKSVSRKSYIKVKRSKLKEEYVKALPFIVVEDIEEVRTELEVEKEKNKKYVEIIENIDERIENKINEAMNNKSEVLNEDDLEDLFS